MKYRQSHAFEKQLEDSLPDHPSEIYALFLEDAEERRFIAERVIRLLGRTATFCGDDAEEELTSLSLFGERRVVVCESPSFKTLPPFGDLIVILMGKSPPPCYKEVERQAVTLDLQKELPWEREKRWRRYLQEEAQRGGKRLSQEGADLLLSFASSGFTPLLQEVEKAATFSGERREITREDIVAIASSERRLGSWEMSEQLVWGEERIELGREEVYRLCPQIRYQLLIGYAVTRGEEVAAPHKKKERIRSYQLPLSYYLEGLKDLFELEMQLRSGVTSYALFLTLFQAKMKRRRDG